MGNLSSGTNGSIGHCDTLIAGLYNRLLLWLGYIYICYRTSIVDFHNIMDTSHLHPECCSNMFLACECCSNMFLACECCSNMFLACECCSNMFLACECCSNMFLACECCSNMFLACHLWHCFGMSFKACFEWK
jgi:hypothetical protein